MDLKSEADFRVSQPHSKFQISDAFSMMLGLKTQSRDISSLFLSLFFHPVSFMLSVCEINMMYEAAD